jgi:DNA polymerase-3 subunit alpha
LTGTVDRGDKGTKLRGSKIEPLAELQTKNISKVTIRLADQPGMSTRLPVLRQVFQKHPGSSSVSLVMSLGPTLEAQTAPLPDVKITPSEHFVADIEEVLGKGTITLVS